jgi:hypothetical protein
VIEKERTSCLNLLTLGVSFISRIKESGQKGRYDQCEDKHFLEVGMVDVE